MIVVSSNGCSTSSATHGAGVENKLVIGKFDQRPEVNRKVNMSD
jgi:hypothetical protein